MGSLGAATRSWPFGASRLLGGSFHVSCSRTSHAHRVTAEALLVHSQARPLIWLLWGGGSTEQLGHRPHGLQALKHPPWPYRRLLTLSRVGAGSSLQGADEAAEGFPLGHRGEGGAAGTREKAGSNRRVHPKTLLEDTVHLPPNLVPVGSASPAQSPSASSLHPLRTSCPLPPTPHCRRRQHLLHGLEQGLPVVLERHDELELSAPRLHGCREAKTQGHPLPDPLLPTQTSRPGPWVWPRAPTLPGELGFLTRMPARPPPHSEVGAESLPRPTQDKGPGFWNGWVHTPASRASRPRYTPHTWTPGHTHSHTDTATHTVTLRATHAQSYTHTGGELADQPCHRTGRPRPPKTGWSQGRSEAVSPPGSMLHWVGPRKPQAPRGFGLWWRGPRPEEPAEAALGGAEAAPQNRGWSGRPGAGEERAGTFQHLVGSGGHWSQGRRGWEQVGAVPSVWGAD